MFDRYRIRNHLENLEVLVRMIVNHQVKDASLNQSTLPNISFLDVTFSNISDIVNYLFIELVIIHRPLTLFYRLLYVCPRPNFPACQVIGLRKTCKRKKHREKSKYLKVWQETPSRTRHYMELSLPSYSKNVSIFYLHKDIIKKVVRGTGSYTRRQK